MASVWYIGRGARKISSAQWLAAGITGSPTDSVWDGTNGYSIAKTSFTAPQLTILGNDSGFNVNAPDGPRTEPTPEPDEYLTQSELQNLAGQESSVGFLRLAGTVPGSVPVVKPLNDGRAGVWEMVHNDTTGYLFHLLAGANMGHDAALYAAGVDNDGIGMLIPNKMNGRGIVGDQRATVQNPVGYWLHATQRSNQAPLVRLEMQANDAAPVLQLLAFGTPGASQRLLYVGDPSGEAGHILGGTGVMEWFRNIKVQNQPSGEVETFFESGTSTSANSSNTRKAYRGASTDTYFSNTGTAGVYYPYRVSHASSVFAIQAAGNLTAADPLNPLPAEVTAWTTVIGVSNAKLGFFGVAPVVRPSAYTQTYSTASKVISNPTAVAVVTTPSALSSYGFTQVQADALIAAVNALQADHLVTKKNITSIIDDLQLLGLGQ